MKIEFENSIRRLKFLCRLPDIKTAWQDTSTTLLPKVLIRPSILQLSVIVLSKEDIKKVQENKDKSKPVDYRKLEVLKYSRITKNLKQNLRNIKENNLGFYRSTFVYSRFPPKIQFLYCLLSSVAPWGGPMVNSEGKIFKI